MILIFYFGSLKELLTVYLKAALSEKSTILQPSTTGFFSFCKSKSNFPNFMYLVNQVTTYAQAIINFRMAMRRNNHQLAQSAAFKLGDLFHGRNHPIYQLIDVYFLLPQFVLPNDVTDLINDSFTISISDDPSKGEDWDFVLENVNKATQKWVPKGLPTNAMWLTACRNDES